MQRTVDNVAQVACVTSMLLVVPLIAGVTARSTAENRMDWLDQADRLWASELGVAPRVLRRGGFHVIERADAAAQPRATIVGTSSATVVSLTAGAAHAFENAGFGLTKLERAPRRYVASCASIPSLDVRGPAYLGYWPTSSAPPPVRGQAESLDSAGLLALASLRDAAPIDWAEAGIGPDSRVFGVRAEGRLVAVTGYERWPHDIAQLQVFCHPGHRRRGLAAESLMAAISHALADNLLPQYRARDGNVASLALANRVGFVEYGWMATVRIRPSDDAVQQSGARDARPGD